MATTTATESHAVIIFDHMAMNVMLYLNSHKYVSSTEFRIVKGASKQELAAWERENSAYRLPEDLINYYKFLNGLKILWTVKFQGQTLPIGNMHINSLKELVRLNIDGLSVANIPLHIKIDTSTCAAFCLESSPTLGNVALIFSEGLESPQVWLHDLNGTWNFIAATFLDYFRLLILYLGLPSWQNCFSDIGLDPISKQWFHLFIPERLSCRPKTCKRN